MMMILRQLMAVVLLMGACAAPARSHAPETTYDVVVYGGSSAGVIAAIQADRMGKRTILVNPYAHLGGMTSSGLGRTDAGRKETIGGLSREFYERVHRVYRDPARWHRQTRGRSFGVHLSPNDGAMWGFEPHVAEEIFCDWLRERKITVVKGRLDRTPQRGVRQVGRRITAIVMESG